MGASSRKIRFSSARRWEYDERDDVAVSAYGIPSEFREAFLNVLVVTRRYYRQLFGEHVIGRVEFNVRKSRRLPLRLWTNGADRVYLTLSRKAQLEPAPLSGVRHLHGLTHELAHIVLYRLLINLSELADGWGEGWAVYLASFWGVPHVHTQLGDQAWPYPYPYLASDGSERYLHAFSRPDWKPLNPTEQVVHDLHLWHQRVGSDTFLSSIRGVLAAPLTAQAFNLKMVKLLRQPRRRRSA